MARTAVELHGTMLRQGVGVWLAAQRSAANIDGDVWRGHLGVGSAGTKSGSSGARSLESCSVLTMLASVGREPHGSSDQLA